MATDNPLHEFKDSARAYFENPRNKKWNFGRFCNECSAMANFPSDKKQRQQLATDIWRELLTEFAEGADTDKKAKACLQLIRIRQKTTTTNNIVNAETVGFVGCTIGNNLASIGVPSAAATAAKGKRKAQSESPVPQGTQESTDAPPPPYEEEKSSSASASAPPKKKARRDECKRSGTPAYDGENSASPSPSPVGKKPGSASPAPTTSVQKRESDLSTLQNEPDPPSSIPATAASDTANLPQLQLPHQNHAINHLRPPPQQSLRQRLLKVSDTLRSLQQYDDDMMDVLLDASKQLMQACMRLKKIQECKAQRYAIIAEQLPLVIDDPLMRENDNWLTSRDETETEKDNGSWDGQGNKGKGEEEEEEEEGTEKDEERWEEKVTIGDFF